MKHSYKSAGVDVEAGYEAVKLMREHVESTLSKSVLGSIGGFGGMFSLKEFKHMEEPILVSGTDGVGTKLKLAFIMDKHDTIGIDCVAMCVNDILCVGAKPLFFLDYIACGKNIPNKIADIVKGVADGCKQSKCSLIGGETAEMPGFYEDGEYDIAGFTVGIVDKEKMIDGSKIKVGDTLIGLPSTGLHSNGFSLVRSVVRPTMESLQENVDSLNGKLGDVLLTPTKIYTNIIFNLLENVEINGISNITGGGFIENIPRMFKEPMCAKINEGTWKTLPIFEFLEKQGELDRMDMYNTFNMGIGMVIAVSSDNAKNVLSVLENMGEIGYIIGEVTEGEGVSICLK